MFSLYFSTRPTEPGASRYHPAVLKSHHQANLATYAGFACQLTLYYNDVRYSFFFFFPPDSLLSSLRRSEYPYPFIALSVDWGLGMIMGFHCLFLIFCTYRGLVRCGGLRQALTFA